MIYNIAKKQKQPKYLSADEWIKKCVYSYNEILERMKYNRKELDNTMSCEISQVQKAIKHMIPFL